MYISNLKIENFKKFKNVEFQFNEHFNLIIGSNNAGKSTMMEALRLWQLAFNKFLKIRTNNKSSSFRSDQYFSATLDDIQFLGIGNMRHLFYNKDATKKIIITLTLTNGNAKVDLPIKYTLSTQEMYLRFELCNTTSERKNTADQLVNLLGRAKGSSLKTTLLISYISPLFSLATNEILYSSGYVLYLIQQAKSNEIIRNILYKFISKKETQNSISRIKEIGEDLSYILYGEEKENFFTFESKFKPEEDRFINISCEDLISQNNVEVNQLGSGTLNLLNILTVLSYGEDEKFDLNVLLLDEPDSHLHADFQKRLFQVLKKRANDKNKQMFVITHNHELIEASDEVLYVEANNSVNKSITKDNYYLIYKTIAPEYHEKMIQLNFLKERLKVFTRPTLYCEGETDVNILKTAYKKLYNVENFFSDELAIEGSSGCEGVFSNLSSPKDSSVLLIGILDHDFATISGYEKLKTKHGFSEENNYLFSKNKKQFCFRLPVPEHRLNAAQWFERNTCIEYMFTDETLEKIGVELIQERGNTYKKFKIAPSKNIDVVSDEVKKQVQNGLEKMDKQDFSPFIPVFETIASILNFTLPEETC